MIQIAWNSETLYTHFEDDHPRAQFKVITAVIPLAPKKSKSEHGYQLQYEYYQNVCVLNHDFGFTKKNEGRKKIKKQKEFLQWKRKLDILKM